jgi:hypothetical protein
MRRIPGLTLLVFLSLAVRVAPATTSGAPQRNNTEMKMQADASPVKGTVESRTLRVRIDRPFATVYEFLVDPANWNRWAFGLGKSLRQSNGGWIADSDGGIVRVRFTPRNKFGVLDHTVIRPSGAQIYVPMRLITNADGCELLFTLFREPRMTDEHYNADANFVQRDLNGLKELLEK